MPQPNGNQPDHVRDAVRLMERVRDVPERVKEHLVREARRRAVERVLRLRRKRGS